MADDTGTTVKLLREQADIVEDAFFPATAAVMRSAADKIAALLERAVTAEADRDEAERRERTAVNLANYHRDVAQEAGRRADAARPPAPTESTPDPPHQPVAGRPTMDLLEGAEDRGQTHTQNKENEHG